MTKKPETQEINPIMQAFLYFAQKDKGLGLISPFPGAGKTYQGTRLPAELVKLGDNRTVIYTTSQKKNLSEYAEKVQKYSKEIGVDGKLKVLEIPSNLIGFIKKINEVEFGIHEQLANTDEFRYLKDAIAPFIGLNDDDELNRALSQKDYKALAEKEHAFRAKAKGFLYNDYKKKEDRREAVLHGDYSYLSELYPAAKIGEANLILLTAKRFYYPVDMIWRGSSTLYEMEFTRGALVLWDEIDAARNELLATLIEEQVDSSVDFLSLGQELNNHVQQKNEAALQDFFDGGEDEKQSGIERFRESRQLLNSCIREYNLNFPTTLDEAIETSRGFIFRGVTYVTAVGGQLMKAYLKNKGGKNIIFTSRSEQEYGAYLPIVISQIESAVRHTAGTMARMAFKFLEQNRRRMAERKIGDNVVAEINAMNLDEAISSILHAFHFDWVRGFEAPKRRYLRTMINALIGVKRPSKSENQEPEMRNPYAQGFMLSSVIQSNYHATQVKLQSYSMHQSPEVFLGKLCQRAMVIGISASAGLETHISNFSHNYLREILKEGFHSLPDSIYRAMGAGLENLTQGFRNGRIKASVDFISAPQTNNQVFAMVKLFRGMGLSDVRAEQYAEEIEAKIGQQQRDGQIDYYLEKYNRLIIVLSKFINQNDSIRSLLYMNAAAPSKSSYSLNTEVVEALVDIVNACFPESRKIETVFVRGQGHYPIDIGNAKKLLAEGRRIIVIASYNTLGVGVNLQYPTPEDIKPLLVPVNQRAEENGSESEKDFDILYLERLTHMLPDVYTGLNLNTALESFFQLNAAPYEGATSVDTAYRFCSEIMKRLSGGAPVKEKNPLTQSRAYVNACMSLIIQITGRQGRTPWKLPEVYLWADEKLMETIASFDEENILLIPTLEKLVEKAKAAADHKTEFYEIEYRASNVSREAANYTKGLLRRLRRSKEKNDEWDLIRQIVLRNPTRIKPDSTNSVLYINTPDNSDRYTFTAVHPMSHIYNISFSGKGEREVSEGTARLPELMLIPGLKEHFKKEGYATSWENGNQVIAPYIFDGIYKGALGEVAMQFLFEMELNIKLVDLPQQYKEIFDFMLPENPNIVFDAKHWSGDVPKSLEEEAEERERVFDKMESCDAKKAFIVNVLNPNPRAFKTSIFQRGDRFIYTVPALVDEQGNLQNRFFRFVKSNLI